jgi:hypothetical protein
LKKQPFVWCAVFLVGSLLTLLLAACGDATSTGSPYSGVSSGTAPNQGTTAAETTAAAATTAASSASNATVNPQPVDQEPLKAGTVDDNAKFSEYLQYLRNYSGKSGLPFDVTERYIINVIDGSAHSVANANIKIYDGQNLVFEGKTYSNGQLLFFPRAIRKAEQVNQFEVIAEKDGQIIRRSFLRSAADQQNQQVENGATWTLDFKDKVASTLETPNLDLLFLLDSTGSMGGEIRKIQQTISDISYQISQLPGSPKIRYGVVTYRDRGDSYVTRKFGFTENLGDFSNFLNSISAGGGGDYPESLNEALHVAVQTMNWNKADAVRLAFLVADAPPHLDYNDDYKYTDELDEAVKRGIKVYAIGASGLDKMGEYVFRQLAEVTMAQYLFITRGGDEGKPGSGGPASNTNVDYQERSLDKLVVNIVQRELANLR